MTYEMYVKMKEGFVPEGMNREDAEAKIKAFEDNAAALLARKAEEKA